MLKKSINYLGGAKKFMWECIKVSELSKSESSHYSKKLEELMGGKKSLDPEFSLVLASGFEKRSSEFEDEFELLFSAGILTDSRQGIEKGGLENKIGKSAPVLKERTSEPYDLNPTLEALFEGTELASMKEKIRTSKLKMRDGWASVPRLSLGAIKIPEPGKKKVMDDEFVLNGALYLVECLDSLGVMSRKEAEDLAKRKLENYFVNQAGGQMSRERMMKIVSGLKESLGESELGGNVA